MSALAQYAPALLMLFLQVALYICQNRGWLTADQSMALMAGLAPLGVHVAYRTQPPPAKGGAVSVGTGALLMLVLLLTGCAGSFEEARGPSVRLGASPEQSARCISLDNKREDFGGTGKGSAVLSGAAGLGTIATKDEHWRLGLAVGSISAAAISAGALFIAEGASSSWVRECSR